MNKPDVQELTTVTRAALDSLTETVTANGDGTYTHRYTPPAPDPNACAFAERGCPVCAEEQAADEDDTP